MDLPFIPVAELQGYYNKTFPNSVKNKKYFLK
jgi:hypothetical protein